MRLEKLIERAKRQEESAIRSLMELVGKKGKYIALSYVNQDEIKADDILQEAIIKAFSSLHQLEDANRFEPWFYRILNNVGINATRLTKIDKESNQFTELESYDLNFEETISSDTVEFHPKENFDYSQLKEGIKRVLDELPIDQKQSIMMYFFEGLNAREIAEAFGVSESTIRSRLKYGKEKIEKTIQSLETEGYSLMGVTPIPFTVWVLEQECKETKLSNQLDLVTIINTSEDMAVSFNTNTLQSSITKTDMNLVQNINQKISSVSANHISNAVTTSNQVQPIIQESPKAVGIIGAALTSLGAVKVTGIAGVAAAVVTGGAIATYHNSEIAQPTQSEIKEKSVEMVGIDPEISEKIVEDTKEIIELSLEKDQNVEQDLNEEVIYEEVIEEEVMEYEQEWIDQREGIPGIYPYVYTEEEVMIDCVTPSNGEGSQLLPGQTLCE